MPTVLNYLIVYLPPLVIWFFWKRKNSARVLPLVVGMGAYILLSLLRGVARIPVLNDSVKEIPWLFYLLSAALSGVFEEVGRYIVFRFAMRNYDRWSDCVSYGIGHGAIEIILTHNLTDFTLFDDLITTYDLVTGAAFSVAMSVLVFAGVHFAENKKGLFAAIALHTVIDFTLVLEYYGIASFGAVILIQLAFDILICYLAYRVFRRYKDY